MPQQGYDIDPALCKPLSCKGAELAIRVLGHSNMRLHFISFARTHYLFLAIASSTTLNLIAT